MGFRPNISLLLKFSLGYGQHPWGHVQFAVVTESEKVRDTMALGKKKKREKVIRIHHKMQF